MYKKITLKNGLRVLLVPDSHTKAVTVMLLVGTGSKYETKDINGISHFLEHMFFKGTKKRPDKIHISEPFDRVGGMYNAFTGEDYTGYFAKVEKTHFEMALDILSDMYLNSTLDQSELERERGVIIEEINMYYDNPMSYVQHLWTNLLYGDQPAGWDIAGTKESVSAITSAIMMEYYKKQYVASNTIAVLSGNFEEKEALEKIEKYMEPIGTAAYGKKAPVLEKQENPEINLHFRETDQTHLCLGFRGYNSNNPKKYAQELLATALGGMMSSRMFLKIREEMGLAYYIRTAVDENPDTGCVLTRAGLDNKRIEPAIKAIIEEYRKIKDEGISEDELKKAKDNVIGHMTLSMESSDALASYYGMQELLEEKIETPEEYAQMINKVTPQDIQEVAKDLFKKEKMNLAIVGPYKDKSQFEKILTI